MFNVPDGSLRINGKKIKTAKTMPSINPATGELIGEFFVADKEHVDLAVEAAREAFKSWKNFSLDRRLSFVRNFRNLAVEKIDEFAKIAAAETGKPINTSMFDAAGAAFVPKYYEIFSKQYLAEEKVRVPLFFSSYFGVRETYKVFDPLGVAAVIVPWNFPIFLSLTSIVPALVAGNTVVLKPSEFSTFVGLAIYDLFEEAGLPPGVFNVVSGADKVGVALTESKLINKIVLTGSSETGIKVIKQCAENVIPLTLELGGVDAMIVLKDASIDEAVDGALFGALSNAGQICISPKRILIAKEIKQEFLRKMLHRIKRLRVGDPLDPNADVGALIDQKQTDTLDQFVKDAITKGAVIHYGGKATHGKFSYYEPTVISNLDFRMTLSHKERFGPIISIFDFSDEDEAVAMANFPEFGLGASVWSKNVKRAEKIARKLDAGTIKINDVGVLTPYSPFGGIKRSGIGKELAKDGLRSMTNEKTIEVVLFRHRFRPYMFPLTEFTYVLGKNMLELFSAPGIGEKIKFAYKSVKYFFMQLKKYRVFSGEADDK